MELSGASAKSMAAGANYYRDLSGMPAKSSKVGKAARAARRAKAKMKAKLKAKLKAEKETGTGPGPGVGDSETKGVGVEGEGESDEEMESSTLRQILMDVPRTFSDVFTKDDHEALRRILNAYSKMNPPVGYCRKTSLQPPLRPP